MSEGHIYGLIDYTGNTIENNNPLTFVNCTFAPENEMPTDNVLIKYSKSGDGTGPRFYNTILAVSNAEKAFKFVFSNIDYEGNEEDATLNDLVFQNCLTNIASLGENPLNAENKTGILDFGFADGGYTLAAGSLALDAGDNALYAAIGNIDKDKDLAGDARLLGESIDIGAYEGIKSDLSAPSATYHPLTLIVAPGIELYHLAAGEHLLEEGSHLHLQFLPEDRLLTAADVLLLVDGVETAFKDFDANHYFSYILNPIKQEHTIVIALRRYTVTLPEIAGGLFDRAPGDYAVNYGDSFALTLTLDAGTDPQTVTLLVNGLAIEPDSQTGETGQAQSLRYRINQISGPVTISVRGLNPTGNADIAAGDIQLRITNYELQIDNSTGEAIEVSVYTPAGHVVTRRTVTHTATVPLEPGVYVVRAGTLIRKVVI